MTIKCEGCGIVCIKCNFYTHRCDCKKKLKDPFSDEKQLLKIRSTQMESRIKKSEMSITKLKLQIQFERMKNKIYTEIIRSQTNINVDDIIKEFDNEIHIYNYDNGNIPIIVHEFVNEVEQTNKVILQQSKKKIVKPKKHSEVQFIIEEEKEVKKKKEKTYRRVKEYIKTTQEKLDDKLKQDVVRVDKEIDKIVYNNFDVSFKDITEEIDELINKIENSRVYTYHLDGIKRRRNKLLGKINLEDYIKLISSHTEKLTHIFKEKNKSRKDIVKNILKSLSYLDMRLIFYEGYTNSTIEIDDVQKFGMALNILTKHKKQFVPYDKYEVFENIKNYGLALFEIKDCIDRSIVNRYGFHNVIYLPRPKSEPSDPYSFYTLEKVSGKNRCWKMECRMEDFVNDFIDHMLQYCIRLFRRIYKDVFNDNIYREDYISKSQITEFDCEQLIQNIILLSKPLEICKIFQDIIISKCTFTSTETDKFNLYGDDRIQKKRFIKLKDQEDDSCNIIKLLFDNITTESALTVLRTRS